MIALLWCALAAAAVDVQITGAQLELVRWVTGRKDPGQVGLSGRVEIVLRNPTEAEVIVRDPDVHGLLFESDDGTRAVVVHGCQCVRDATEPAAGRLVLPPGAVHTIVLEDFGCSGGPWEPPPPGAYRLTYRVPPYVELPPADEDIPALLAGCRAALLDWPDADVSPPRPVALAEPRRMRVP